MNLAEELSPNGTNVRDARVTNAVWSGRCPACAADAGVRLGLLAQCCPRWNLFSGRYLFSQAYRCRYGLRSDMGDGGCIRSIRCCQHALLVWSKWH